MFKNCLKYAVMLLCAALYGYVFWSLNRGVSSDEGWYLMGFVQPIEQSAISDFHIIIRTFFWFLDFENLLQLRYFYFFFSLAFIALFAISSYSFFKSKMNLKIDGVIYVSLIFMLSLFSYTFTSPILHYDTLQFIIYLIVFSLLFYASVNKKSANVLFPLVGFFSLYALVNYLPSGILLLLFILIWVIIQKQMSLKSASYFTAGFLLSTVIYHLFIHSLVDFVGFALNSIEVNAESHNPHMPSHGITSLMFGLMVYTTKVLLLSAIIFIIAIFVFFGVRKINNKIVASIIHLLFYLLVFVFSFLFRLEVLTTMFLFPIVFLLADVISAKIVKRENVHYSIPKISLLLLFLVIPVGAVFGTNQPLERKTMIFLVFWLLAFFTLYAEYKTILSDFNKKHISIVYCGFVLIFFSYFGFFTRAHNFYYGIRRAEHKVENTRLSNIRLVEYERNYIRRLHSILIDNGFERGDTILAFEIDLIDVYAFGASVPNKLFFNVAQMIDRQFIPENRINFILVLRRDEERLISHLSKSDWQFPEHYKRIDIGRRATNISYEDSSVLYVFQRNHSPPDLKNKNIDDFQLFESVQ